MPNGFTQHLAERRVGSKLETGESGSPNIQKRKQMDRAERLRQAQYKVSSMLGCTYVCSQLRRQDIQQPFNALWGISLLLSGADAFSHPAYNAYINKSLNTVEDSIYEQNSKKLIVINGATRPIWDAMYVKCLFKMGLIGNALVHCRGISLLETHRDHNGVLISAFLDAFEHSQNELYLDWARKTRVIVQASERLSAFDAWGLVLLADKDNQYVDETESHIERMLKTADVAAKNMVGIVGPMTLQLCQAHKHLTGDHRYDSKYEEVLDHQMKLQVTTKHYHGLQDHYGAFVHSQVDPHPRIDYTIGTAFALLYHSFQDPKHCF